MTVPCLSPAQPLPSLSVFRSQAWAFSKLNLSHLQHPSLQPARIILTPPLDPPSCHVGAAIRQQLISRRPIRPDAHAESGSRRTLPSSGRRGPPVSVPVPRRPRTCFYLCFYFPRARHNSPRRPDPTRPFTLHHSAAWLLLLPDFATNLSTTFSDQFSANHRLVDSA